MVLVQGPLSRDNRPGTVLCYSVLSLHVTSTVTMQAHVRIGWLCIHYPSTLSVLLTWPFFCPCFAEVNFLGRPAEAATPPTWHPVLAWV